MVGGKDDDQDNDFPMPDGNEEDDFIAPMPDDDDDDDDHQGRGGAHPRESLLSLDGTTTPAKGGASIGGLEDDDDDLQSKEGSSSKRSAPPPQRKRKKRRKVIVDNDQTELSNEHIKNMLKHTEDLIRTDMVPPNQRSARARALHNKTKFSSTAFSKKNKNKNHKRGLGGGKGVKANKPRLARPFLDNDDSFPLAPQLAALWEANHYRILGKPRPFRLLQVEQEQEEQQVEQARAAGDGDSVTSQPDMPMPDDEDNNFQAPMPDDDDDNAMPMPDDDEDDNNFQAPMPDDDDDEHDVSAMTSSPIGKLSLGLVNELNVNDVSAEEGDVDEDEDEDDEDHRREQYQEGTQTKWHKHTVKVLTMLQTNMANSPEEATDEQPAELLYGTLSNGCSRRTASSVFFELLQLKTWDFVEIDQEEPYGEIVIRPGNRFEEPPPNAASAK